VIPGVGDFTLTGRNGAGAGTTLSWSSPVANPLGAASYWIITFSGAPIIGGSLADGIYDLAVVASQIHAGTSPDPTTGARALPIYATTAYQFRDSQHAADLFALAELGNIYTRIMNPTQDALEQRVASLEGGVAALAVSSGQSATTLAILNVAETGDHVVASASLYGGTYNLLHHSLPKLGITVSFVEDPDDPEAWQALVQDKGTPFFTTKHFDGHLSVLLRASRVGELSRQELAEVIQEAWLSRASRRRAADWLAANPPGRA